MSTLAEARETKNVRAWDLQKGQEVLLPVRIEYVGTQHRLGRDGVKERPVFLYGFSEPFWRSEKDVMEVIE